MKYIPPYGVTSNPDASYVNGDPSIGRQGSIPPASVFENPQREIVNLVSDSAQIPADTDLHQLTRGVRDGKLNFCVDSGPLNQLQVQLFGPPLLAYTAGLTLRVLVAHTNTGPVRISVGTLNPTTVKRRDGSELQANDILAGMVATLVCDGTYFQLQNMGPGDGTGGGDTNLQLVDLPYVRDTGTANHLIGLYSPPLADIREGRTVLIKVANNVTGTTDFTPNNFPTHPVVHPDGSPLLPGDGVIGQIWLLTFDGVNWQMSNWCCGLTSTVPPTPTIQTGKSLRFWYRQPDQSSHLRRTPAQNGDRQVWTVSFFVQRVDLGVAGIDFGGPIAQAIEAWFGAGSAASGGDYTGMYFSEKFYNNSPNVNLYWNAGANGNWGVAVPGSAGYVKYLQADTKWHHFLLNANGAQISCFYDGDLVAQGTTYGQQGSVNASGRWQEFGTDADTGAAGFSYNEYYGSNVRMAEIYLVDGTCHTWDKFANNIGGVFLPKKYNGPWGVNGCYLNFDNSSAATETTLGKDQSGQNNNWLPFNISINDVSTEYPR